MSDLYLDNGYLNAEYIGSKEAWLIVIIGRRQVGKTYGVLQYMLRHDLKHILLRRTTAELQTIAASPSLNPYKVFEPEYRVGLFKSGQKLSQIAEYSMEGDKAIQGRQLGLAMSLAEIAHVRGFNGSEFSDLVFDEFIPEKGVIIRRSEGDAFLNAYTTINGNRELQGRPPLRAWLLANANSVDSPVMEALNITDAVLWMRRKGRQELLTDKGVFIVQPDSVKITEAREDTALMKQISEKSEFYGMAQKNEFSYDANPLVKNRSIKSMQPVWAIGDIYCWASSVQHHVCRAAFTSGDIYDDTIYGREKLAAEYSYMRMYYQSGVVTFSDLRALSLFRRIFHI